MNESPTVAPLLDKLKGLGFKPETCALDKGYDNGPPRRRASRSWRSSRTGWACPRALFEGVEAPSPS